MTGAGEEARELGTEFDEDEQIGDGEEEEDGWEARTGRGEALHELHGEELDEREDCDELLAERDLDGEGELDCEAGREGSSMIGPGERRELLDAESVSSYYLYLSNG